MSRATKRWWPGISYGRGEDWHYVGESGEPAWADLGSGAAWENSGASFNLAFRVREAGVVDIQGTVAALADPPIHGVLFYLPTGYRPTVTTYAPIWAETTDVDGVPAVLLIQADGQVAIQSGADDPYPTPGNTAALRGAIIACQLFLDPADAP